MTRNKKESRNRWLRTPKGRFYQQKCTAKQRGIEFLLTFEEWWTVWEPHWNERGGQNGDKLCMCRHGDSGAYELNNIFIATNRENNKDVNGKSGLYDSAAKINQELADEIREELAKGFSCRELSEKYPLSRQAITDIKFNRTWVR